MKSNNNRTLSKARANKNDEFYTQLNDISNELKHYRAKLKGKTVLCNCDDPFESQFFKYFALNFNSLGLKKLIATSYSRSPIVGKQLSLLDMEGLKPECKDPYAVEINEVPDTRNRGTTDITDVEYLLKRRANTSRTLIGDDTYAAGDFRSRECVELLKQADLVITNPPFSLFREFVGQLAKHKKKFLIVGNHNAVLYKEVFKLIMDGKLWLGVDNGGTKWFQVPDDYDIKTESRKKIVNGVKYFSMGSIAWFTNLDHKRRHEWIPLYKKYSKKEYPTYDNYDAIDVSRVAEIPKDYSGVMGVPITFLDKFNADQFELLGSNRGIDQDPDGVYGRSSLIRGKETFKRLFIRNRHPETAK